MKLITTVLLGLFLSSTAQATIVPCPLTVKLSMEQNLGKNISINNVKESMQFPDHTVYDVLASANYEDGQVGIPYSAQYKVLTESFGQGACRVVDAVLVSEAQ